MSIFSKLWSAISGKGKSNGEEMPSEPSDRYTVPDDKALWVFVRCKKCGEKIKLRIRTTDEVQEAEPEDGFEYYVNKTIVGNKCFNRIEASFFFDAKYRLINSDLYNGELITEKEFIEGTD
ncbi:MAG: hypothetical protein GX020_05640 [Firmicutes bacterium]|nr:hypothetical protein [Bacillota bacterium]